MGASTVLNNTILIPASDGIPQSHPLTETTVVKDSAKFSSNYEKRGAIQANIFKIRLNQGGKSTDIGFCEAIDGLTVKRKVEKKRVGGNAEYLVKLPGPLEYSEISFTNIMTDNGLFLEWVVNGANFGGVQRADIEILVGTDDDCVVYTLRDAFPVSWTLGTMKVDPQGLVLPNTGPISFPFKNNEIPMSTLKIVYSKLDVDVNTSGS